MIELHALRQPADAATVASAWQALDSAGADVWPGAHLGVEAGVPGLHPLQATLLPRADWTLRLFDDGIALAVHTDWAQQLFELPALRAWADRAARGGTLSGTRGGTRGAGWPVREALRAFSALFAPAPHPLLIGALRFDAHRLVQGGERSAQDHSTTGEDASLGLLMGGCEWLQRDEHGAWWTVRLSLPGASIGDAAVRDAASGGALFRSASQMEPPTNLQQDAAADLPADPPPGAHANRVRRSLPLLASGELVSLTLSQSYRRRVPIRAREAYDRLRSVNPAPGCFYVNDGQGERVFGASPDLQLRVHGRTVTSYPVCGTVARQSGAVGASESLRELINEAVDAAALAVCTDALRDDLAPWCVPGSLRLLARREPMFLSTVVHTVDALQGRLRDDAHAWDLILATAAPAMVTGSSRAAAVRAIADLEAGPRGWYSGMVLMLQADGDAQVVTLLRAATVRDGVAEVRTGGDILADSDPDREEAESRLKTRSLWRAFGLEADPAAAQAGGAGDAPGAPSEAGTSGASGASHTSSSTDAKAHARAATAPRPCVQVVDPSAAFAQGLADALQSAGVDVLDAASLDASPAAASLASTAVRIATEWRADSAPSANSPLSANSPHATQPPPLLALGDAALQCLAADGATVQMHAAGRGRLLRWRPTDEGRTQLAPWMPVPDAMWVGAHASRRLAGAVPAGWQVWAVDANGAPLMLAHREYGARPGQVPPAPPFPCVLMLFRPDSLLSDAAATPLLRAALQWLGAAAARCAATSSSASGAHT